MPPLPVPAIRAVAKAEGSLVAPRPAWGRLYAVLLVTAGLALAAHLALPAGAWRTASEYGVAFVASLLFALWVAANRSPRTQLEISASFVSAPR